MTKSQRVTRSPDRGGFAQVGVNTPQTYGIAGMMQAGLSGASSVESSERLASSRAARNIEDRRQGNACEPEWSHQRRELREEREDA